MYIHDGIEQELQGNAIHIKQGNINTLIDNVDVVFYLENTFFEKEIKFKISPVLYISKAGRQCRPA